MKVGGPGCDVSCKNRAKALLNYGTVCGEQQYLCDGKAALRCKGYHGDESYKSCS